VSDDRRRWDARHEAERGTPARPPDSFVATVVDELGPGAGRGALDLASGAGRHALLLAARGFRVRAVDVSPVGLDLVRERAEAAGLSVETQAFDLSAGLPESEAWDVIVVVDFLDRALLAELPRRLSPGGSLVVSTFTTDWPEAHPSPQFRLARGELRSTLAGLEHVSVVEEAGRAGIWARRREDS
jgi:SAM-dependent methyltransferase